MRLCLTLLLWALGIQSALCFSLQRELDLGKEVAAEAEKEMPPSKNEQWQADIAAMGQQIARYVSRKQIPYHFRILCPKDANEINAFAIPGGYVYFTERMWRILTPAERAGVLSHEVTHCDRRHGIDQMIKAQQRLLWTLPILVFSLGTGSQAGGMALWGNAIINQRYSRKMEREADEYGIKLCTSAGFDPAGMVTAMKKLLFIETDENRYEISAIFASHPDTQKRIDYLTQAALAMGAPASRLELAKVDDPARLGNVTKKAEKWNVIYASVPTGLAHGQKVSIKKMLWDDDKQVLAPKAIAAATVLAPGRYPILTLDYQPDSSFADVMPGDGIYPEVPVPPVPSTPAEGPQPAVIP